MTLLTRHGGGEPEGYDVTIGGTQLAAADTDLNRTFWSVVNTSDTPIYIALYTEAEVGKGIYLAPEGGSFELNNTNMHTGEIWAIHEGSGDKRVTVQTGK